MWAQKLLIRPAPSETLLRKVFQLSRRCFLHRSENATPVGWGWGRYSNDMYGFDTFAPVQ